MSLLERRDDGAKQYEKDLRRQERADARPTKLTLVKDSDRPKERVPLHQREVPAPDPFPSREQLAAAARYRLARSKVHLRNSWRYAGIVARWARVGGRVVWAYWWRWAKQAEHRAFEKTAARTGNHKSSADHRAVANRGTGAAAATAVAVVLALGWFAAHGRLAALATVGLVVAALAAIGRQPTERLAEAAPEKARVLAPDTLLKAFEDAGFPGAATVGAPAIEGKGINRRLRVIVDLAPGKDNTATAVMKKREQIAGNLRRDMTCVHLSRGGHAGQVILTVLDQDPMAGPPVPSPLLSMSEWCLWDPIPWGFDIRGATVYLPLLWTSLLVGAKPRMGKTFSIRTLVLAAALDVHARVYLWDGKGGGDYRAFKPVCAAWGQGHAAAKKQPKACLDMLRKVSALVDERNEKIDALPTHLRPQGKLTREVSRDPRFGLPLILVVVDEVQRLVADKEWGDEIRDELIALAQNAPSCGVIVIVGAQRPTQGTDRGSLGSLPPAMGSRAAFKTMTSDESNVVLGKGMAGDGYDSSVFPDDYEGVCVLVSGAEVSEGPKSPQTVKAFYADDTHLEAKMAAVVAARAAGGACTAVLEKRTVADDARLRLAEVFEAGEGRLALRELARRLGVELADARRLTREAGVKVKTMRVGGGPVEGVDRADLD